MRNAYVLLIMQAMLISLLFFSEGYVRYVTIALFLLFDLILFIDILIKKWSHVEILTFAAIFCSGLFLMFYLFMKSSITMIFGVAVMLLFLVIAMLSILSKTGSRTTFDLRKPEAPEYVSEYAQEHVSEHTPGQYYDAEYQPDADYQPYYDANIKKPEPVMHVTSEARTSQVKNKLAAKAVIYELEKEARELENAEKLISKMEKYNAEKELLRESRELEAAQKQIDALKNAEKTAKAAKELKKEAKEIMKVQKQIDDIQKLKELEREAKVMKTAEKQIKEIQFLNQQEKIVSQAKAIAKAQKDIDSLKSKKISRPVPAPKFVKVAKVIKAKDESFYFATKNGNKFHEPGCMTIKRIPKKKLTLFTNKKEALKKGLQPCNTCIPK
jgi:hypothetical protein